MAEPLPNPTVAHMVAALRALPQVPQAAPYTPNYVAPVANLNPNLAKAAQRVQMAASGQAKPNQASWG